MKEIIYQCTKGCTVSNRKVRCNRCGEWMLSMGSKTREEVIEEVKQRQLAASR